MTHHTPFDRRVNAVREAMKRRPDWGKPCPECRGRWLSRQNRQWHESWCSKFQELYRKSGADLEAPSTVLASAEAAAPVAGGGDRADNPPLPALVREGGDHGPSSPTTRTRLPELTPEEITEQDRERAALADIRSPVFASSEVGEEWRTEEVP